MDLHCTYIQKLQRHAITSQQAQPWTKQDWDDFEVKQNVLVI